MDDSTVQMGEKDTAYAKAISIATSCQTREQLEAARTYVRQFVAAYGIGPESDDLWRLIKDVDARLFPESQKPLEDSC
jgi:hypothetical protein